MLPAVGVSAGQSGVPIPTRGFYCSA